ncbi:hypothetical protein SynSYN20_00179 [Synechococcus sp. SYN20]|nr:hypothetical protein SynSYN20_00179 [Synechococcus sp. SYN20]
MASRACGLEDHSLNPGVIAGVFLLAWLEAASLFWVRAHGFVAPWRGCHLGGWW